jgi:hypothetical protein
MKRFKHTRKFFSETVGGWLKEVLQFIMLPIVLLFMVFAFIDVEIFEPNKKMDDTIFLRPSRFFDWLYDVDCMD